ncbi:hypothetical protein PIB30_051940 [Stylosanthes scabra]|uniref:Uncharacterized protein n=1 Tax=Stylosanthes scabra TaxID=79078 RepID=A0ABU6VKD2_9FABA|nr:hypothetical protein [Stylosanthes scabra]
MQRPSHIHMTVATTSISFSPSSGFLGMKLLKPRYLKTTSFRHGSSGFIPCLPGNKNCEAIQIIRECGFIEGNNNNNNQQVQVMLEQETFTNGFWPELLHRSKCLFHDVESTLNHLISSSLALAHGILPRSSVIRGVSAP